ncbi:MAG TPA: hypothetical protein VF804_10980 [Holophagaceae bacterium]
MREPLRLAACTALVSCALPGLAQTNSLGAVSGRSALFPAAGHSYLLTAPPGWIFDGKGDLPGAPRAIFRPAAASDPPPIAYTNYFADATNAAGFVETELARFRAANPQAILQTHPDLSTLWGMKVSVHSFRGDRHGHSGWIGYVVAPQGVIQIVMLIPAPEARPFEAAFATLVRSCVWQKFDLVPSP